MTSIKPEPANHNTDNALSAPLPPNSSNRKAHTSWRDWLTIHPAAELFPLATEDIRALAADIKQHGLCEPASVIKDEHGFVLLDGRSRLDAMEMAGKKIDLNDRGTFQQLSACIDIKAFVISKNIHRRHLTSEQKRELIGKLLEATPEKSNLQIARQIKVDDKTVGAVRREKEARSEIPNVEVRTDTKGRQQPVRIADKKPAKVNVAHEAGWRIIKTWDEAGPKEREAFVRARKIEIMRAQQEIDKRAFTPDLDIIAERTR